MRASELGRMLDDTVFVDNLEKHVHGVNVEPTALDSDVDELPATQIR